ncbi:unnamed protein product [Amoebophrya sp. A25]|nr:unnamed protein product [Amoebophrya sp. A25]|eukprot:GSA25T00013418001.1
MLTKRMESSDLVSDWNSTQSLKACYDMMHAICMMTIIVRKMFQSESCTSTLPPHLVIQSSLLHLCLNLARTL